MLNKNVNTAIPTVTSSDHTAPAYPGPLLITHASVLLIDHGQRTDYYNDPMT